MIKIVFLGGSGSPPRGLGKWTLIVCDHRLTGECETTIHSLGVSHRIRSGDLRKYLRVALQQAGRDGYPAIYVSGSTEDGAVATQFAREQAKRRSGPARRT